jgi:hypothetical protein
VEDADEAVAELAQCGVVADLSSSHRVVVGAGAGRATQSAQGPLVHGVAEAVVVDMPCQHGSLRARGPGESVKKLHMETTTTVYTWASGKMTKTGIR